MLAFIKWEWVEIYKKIFFYVEKCYKRGRFYVIYSAFLGYAIFLIAKLLYIKSQYLILSNIGFL